MSGRCDENIAFFEGCLADSWSDKPFFAIAPHDIARDGKISKFEDFCPRV
jgi:hypothetical protein